MEVDNPHKPEFASWQSYGNFARQAREDARYAETEAGKAFLATVLATCASRNMTISAGQILWRAQLDYDEQTYKDDGGLEHYVVFGHGRERMIPKAEMVRAGRANPAGIAFLYLASGVETAISEMRPWLRAGISVAQFRVKRKLTVLNLTEGHGRFGFEKLKVGELDDEKIDANTKQEAVWTDIDAAFSRPVSRNEMLTDYAPTQLLAAGFRSHGYEGLVYRSNFGDREYSIVLFNPDDAEIRNCTPYDVKMVKVIYEESASGQGWFAK